MRVSSRPTAISAVAPTPPAPSSALEAAGVIFVDENGQGAGVRLRKPAPDPDSFPPDQLNASNDE